MHVRRNLLFVVPLLAAALLSGCGSVIEGPDGPRFVAVGADGTIASSPDGKQWFPETSGVDQDLFSVAFGKGTFVAVSEGGFILTSPDGRAWTPRYSPTTTALTDVIFTGERFVAVGGSWDTGAATVVSADGLTWQNVLSPGGHMFHAVAHRNDVLVAAAYTRSDLQTPALFTSPPGEGWQEGTGPDFRDSIFHEDRIYTVGASSVNRWSDGLGWSSAALSGNPSMFGMAQGGELFVAVGGMGAIYTSTDAEQWTDRSIAGEMGWLSGVAHGDATFVAVGSEGRIFTSADGAAWKPATAPTAKNLMAVAFKPGEGG
jgi:uncharacterized protein YceK